jgi:hypothetical protein
MLTDMNIDKEMHLGPNVAANGLAMASAGSPIFADGAGPARKLSPMPVTVGASTHDLLIQQGYKLVDDAWDDNGRKTYSHDNDASGTQIANLKKTLGSAGWVRDRNALWGFRHPITDEIIEVEPGGPDTSGHFLHHMKALD